VAILLAAKNPSQLRHRRPQGISVLNQPALAPTFHRVFFADLIPQTSQNPPVLMLVIFWGKKSPKNEVILKKITKSHLTFDLPWSSLSLDVERNNLVTERNELWFLFCFLSRHSRGGFDCFWVHSTVPGKPEAQGCFCSSVSNKIPRFEIYTELPLCPTQVF